MGIVFGEILVFMAGIIVLYWVFKEIDFRYKRKVRDDKAKFFEMHNLKEELKEEFK